MFENLTSLSVSGGRAAPRLESLEDRTTPAVVAPVVAGTAGIGVAGFSTAAIDNVSFSAASALDRGERRAAPGGVHLPAPARVGGRPGHAWACRTTVARAATVRVSPALTLTGSTSSSSAVSTTTVQPAA